MQIAGVSDFAVKLILELAGGTADVDLLVAGAAPAGRTEMPVALDK